METTGLSPFDDKVITIQMRREGVTTIWKEWELGEPRIIESFFDFLTTIRRKEEIIMGYGILKFDVPFLDERCRRLNIMNTWKWNILHSWLGWLDLYQLLGDEYYKFKDWAQKLLGIKLTITGMHIPKLYMEQRYGAILRYVEAELLSMERIYEQMRKEPFFIELMKLRGESSDNFM